jgi:hypothetical protein
MKPRVLPADVYDTLELSALAYGGIGGGMYFEYGAADFRPKGPLCAIGHIAFAMPGEPPDNTWDAVDLLWPIDSTDNDRAVGKSGNRISFAEWCRRLNVVRGAA